MDKELVKSVSSIAKEEAASETETSITLRCDGAVRGGLGLRESSPTLSGGGRRNPGDRHCGISSCFKN